MVPGVMRFLETGGSRPRNQGNERTSETNGIQSEKRRENKERDERTSMKMG